VREPSRSPFELKLFRCAPEIHYIFSRYCCRTWWPETRKPDAYGRSGLADHNQRFETQTALVFLLQRPGELHQAHAETNYQKLANVRVLDFGRCIAGPYPAILPGYPDAGIIRIERIGGSEDHYIAPVTASGEGGVFLQATCTNPVLVSTSAMPGREVVARGAASARGGANLAAALLQRLGLDDTRPCEVRPVVILASRSSCGDRGPDAGKVVSMVSGSHCPVQRLSAPRPAGQSMPQPRTWIRRRRGGPH
jgi:hypothetical protein